MSELAIRWARFRCIDLDAPRLTTNERNLLTVLATYHSELDGAIWPIIPDLAAQMDLSPRRIQQLLHGLEIAGCLTRDSRGGRGHATAYILSFAVKGEIKGEIKGERVQGRNTERVQESEIKGERIKGERVQSAVPDGGTIGGSYPELRSTSSAILSESPKTTRAARAVKAPEKSVEVITAELVAEYADIWTAEQVRDIIGRALNHKSSTRWLNKERGIKDWLRRDAATEREKRQQAGLQTGGSRNGTGPPAATATAARVSPFDSWGTRH